MLYCPSTRGECQNQEACRPKRECFIKKQNTVNPSRSQPEPTNQAPAAPPLEQLADSEFELWQDDCWMAGTSGPREDALRDILHYAMVYGQDGPVKVYEVKRTLIPHE